MQQPGGARRRRLVRLLPLGMLVIAGALGQTVMSTFVPEAAATSTLGVDLEPPDTPADIPPGIDLADRTVEDDLVDEIPTPVQEGLWAGLTVPQARELVAFPVRVPDPVPSPFVVDDVMARGPYPPSRDGPPNRVILHFATPSNSSIQLEQTTLQREVATAPDTTETTLTIDDREVTKTVRPRGGQAAAVSYRWEQDDISFVLTGRTGDSVTESRLEQLISAVPQ